MTKKLELIKRHDIDGLWYIIRLTIYNKLPDSKCYSDEKEAIYVFERLYNTLSILGDEAIVRSEVFPPIQETAEPEKPKNQYRKVYISVDTGECYDRIPDNHTGGFYDIWTDAPIDVVENEFYKCSGVNDTPVTALVAKLQDLGFAASRNNSSV